MKMFNVNVNGNDYRFVCEVYDNYNSWGHKAVLFKNNYEIGQYKIRYFNRTWESYQFESVMKNLVWKLIDTEKEYIEKCYRQDNNVNRMNKEHREKLEKLYEDSEEIKEYNELYEKLGGLR